MVFIWDNKLKRNLEIDECQLSLSRSIWFETKDNNWIDVFMRYQSWKYPIISFSWNIDTLFIFILIYVNKEKVSVYNQ